MKKKGNELVDLIAIGLASYSFKLHIASDIPVDGCYVDPTNVKTQQNLENICQWTKEIMMELNKEKQKPCCSTIRKISNFQPEYQQTPQIQK